MSWDKKLFDTAQPGKDLHKQIDELLEQQRGVWPALRDGIESLDRLRRKTLYQNQSSVIVQANPGRRASIGAHVDPQSIAKRPCFLCEENMPAEERCIRFENLAIFPNPFPIQPRHLTVPIHGHEPQRLEGRLGLMMRLAVRLEPDMLVFYNGARCGASAPDHFHFQACSSAGVPLVEDLDRSDLPNGLLPYRGFGRKMLVFSHPDPQYVFDAVLQTLDVLTKWEDTDQEPLFNLVTLYRKGRYLLILIPRAKHRPACYFAENEDRITVSPATLEMAGILVLAHINHFDRLNENEASAIYEEVSIDEERFNDLIAAIT